MTKKIRNRKTVKNKDLIFTQEKFGSNDIIEKKKKKKKKKKDVSSLS